jgi:hypothetical protein
MAVSAALGQTVRLTAVVQCEYFSAQQGGYYPVPPKPHEDRNAVQYLGNGDWLRYDSVNFCAGVFDSVAFRNAGQGGNQTMRRAHLKLGGPTGADVAVFDMAAGGWTALRTQALTTKLSGYQTLCLTFEGGDTVCWIADWLRFSGSATYTASEAATYFVAPDGNDGNNGLSLEKPFKTIQQAANVMKPGSTCNIRQGIYRETVCPTYTGLSSGAPLTFQAYNGELVYIDGADSVTGWTKYSGNIYKTTMPWSLGKYKNQLMVDGKTCVVARSPNIDDPWPVPESWGVGMHIHNWNRWQQSGEIHPFLCPSRVFFWNFTTTVADPVTGVWNPNSIFTMSLQDPASQRVMPNYLFDKPADYYKGGLFTSQHTWWVLVSEIKSSSCTGTDPRLLTINYGKAINNASISGENGSGPGYISYLLQLLDEPNEWFRDSAGAVYLWAPDGGDPSHHLVEAKRRLTGFDLTNKSYVTLKGLRFIATSATLQDAWYCTIDDCHWKYPSYYDAYEWYEEFAGANWFGSPYDPSDGFSGVFIGGGYNVVKNSSSQVSAGSGFIFSGRGHHLATNNIVHDCNWLPTYNAGIRQYKRDIQVVEDCGGSLYEYNTIYNCGRATIEIDYGGDFTIPGERTKIMHNDLGRSGWLADETMSQWTHGVRNVETAYNRFHSVCSGGYVDADPTFGAWGYKVHHNLFFRGSPINGKLALSTVNYSLNGMDTNTTFFSNTIVDSAAMSYLQEKQWLTDGHYKPWFQANNIFGWCDTAKWMYTDAAHGDYTLRQGSPAVDAGVIIPDWLKQFPKHADDDQYQSVPGTWDSYSGKAPDLGAFEYGQPAWRAGADWQEKPWVYPPPLDPGALIGAQRLRGILAPRLRIGPRALILNTPAGTAYTVMLYNMQGAVVLARSLPKGGTAVVPTSGISAGMYALRVHAAKTYVAQWKVCIRQ